MWSMWGRASTVSRQATKSLLSMRSFYSDSRGSILTPPIECEPLPGYRLKVRCSDGASGVFDMSKYLERGAFKQLKALDVFNAVHLVFGVPTWSGDIDIAPEHVRSDMVPCREED